MNLCEYLPHTPGLHMKGSRLYLGREHVATTLPNVWSLDAVVTARKQSDSAERIKRLVRRNYTALTLPTKALSSGRAAITYLKGELEALCTSYSAKRHHLVQNLINRANAYLKSRRLATRLSLPSDYEAKCKAAYLAALVRWRRSDSTKPVPSYDYALPVAVNLSPCRQYLYTSRGQSRQVSHFLPTLRLVAAYLRDKKQPRPDETIGGTHLLFYHPDYVTVGCTRIYNEDILRIAQELGV